MIADELAQLMALHDTAVDAERERGDACYSERAVAARAALEAALREVLSTTRN